MDPFVSYAQNFEDVMLWRALRHVEHGCYIDAGAAEPEIESVTCAFYQRGWRGLNIEPMAPPFERLEAARPRDINLNVALGAVEGEAEMLQVGDGNGLSTLKTSRRADLEAEGWPVATTRVPVRRLADLCREHVQEPIHFLKIDVEGAEREVIEGAELQTWRPWIIVVEATQPNSTVSAHEAWEELVLAAGYRLVYADGLNRFYLAHEHEDLAAAFAAPPNVFDRFIRREEWLAKRDAESLYQQVVGLDAAIAKKSETELELGEKLRLAQTERDTALQELWESNRLVGVLSAERQGLVDRVTNADNEHRQLAARLAATRRPPAVSGQRASLFQQLVAVVDDREALEQRLDAVSGERQSLAAQVAAALEERRTLLERLTTALDQHATVSEQLSVVTAAQQRLAQSEEQLRQLVAALYRSTSWRLTAPLRLLKPTRPAP